jgi:hypothetical protein
MSTAGEILDYFDAFEQGGKVVVVKKFAFESEARLYAAQLTQVGIPNFLSNTNTAATLPIPLLGVGSVSLHVRETDAAAAEQLIADLEQRAQQAAAEETFYEADEDEIEYQRELNRSYRRDSQRIFFWLAVALVLLLILRAFLRASGTIDASWNPF